MSDQESDDETRGIGPGSRGISGRLAGNNKKPGRVGFSKKPGKPNTPSQQRQGTLTYVQRADIEWKLLRPDLPPGSGKLMKNVTIKPWNDHPNSNLRAALNPDQYLMWTNSQTEIYVIPPPRLTPIKESAYWRVYLYHEAVHVIQFAQNSNKPPKKYADMMKYERDAYCQTYHWINKTNHPAKQYSTHKMNELRKEARRNCKDMSKSIKKIRRNKKKSKREEEYEKYLGLPSHNNISDLYQ